MPHPRRHVHLLVNHPANQLVPTYTEAAPRRSDVINRCQRCRCRLANDQSDHYCSPCQRWLNDTPEWISDLLE